MPLERDGWAVVRRMGPHAVHGHPPHGAIDKAARSRGLTRSAFLASAARDKILA